MPIEVEPLELANLQFQVEEEEELQARIVIARDYYEGNLDDTLADKLENSLIAADADMLATLYNIYATVVDDVKDRLSVVDLADTPAPGPGEPDDGQTVEWAMDFWQDSQLDELQHDVYERALVDRESFVILSPEFDPQTAEPVGIRAIPHQRYTDAEQGGDNEGVKLHYAENERPGITPTMASKRWVESVYEDGERTTRKRMTLYISANMESAARIEKYVQDGDEWVQHRDVLPDGSTEEWPLWWTVNGTEGGESLPLPVVHFRTIGGRGIGHRAVGPQILIDNIIAALAIGANTMGNPMLSLSGAYPTTDGEPPEDDGSNVLQIGPGVWLYFPSIDPDEFSLEVLKPGDLSQIVEVLDRNMMMAALTNSTPSLLANRIGGFQTSGETLRRLDMRPVANARRLQDSFGNAWSKVLEIGAILMNAYGIDEAPPISETGPDPVHTRWAPADIFGEAEEDNEPAQPGREQDSEGQQSSSDSGGEGTPSTSIGEESEESEATQ